MLTTDFDYYTAHQAEIAEKHLGEYVVIKDARVLGWYLFGNPWSFAIEDSMGVYPKINEQFAPNPLLFTGG